jgi:hypothetical protein
VERHAHSHRVAGSQTAAQRDATVFWNYVDLRFAPTADCQLRVVLTRDYLVVALHGSGPEQMPPDVQLSRSAADPDIRNAAESCETCGVTECFRHSTAADLPRTGGVTWLVDRFEPEFDRWIQHHRQPEDVLIMPVAPGIAPAQYLWSSEGFRKVHAAPLATLRRSLISRRLAAQGAERQRMLLKLDHALAAVFVRNIPFTCDHVVVSQNLLPQLWRSGVLGGRTFDVLMTRSPIAHLERVLDEAAAAHPTSRTLADFRAPAELRETETEALAAARCWVTPHSGIAELAGPRSIKLPWATPAAREMPKGDRNLIVFPSSTLARKGCYELREAARELGLKIHFVGQVLETDGFWTGQGVALHGDGWMAMAAAVVLPAWVEHWPRRLLRAAAAGVPVIASSACGLNGIRNLQECSPGDAGTLRDLLAGVLGGIPA